MDAMNRAKMLSDYALTPKLNTINALNRLLTAQVELLMKATDKIEALEPKVSNMSGSQAYNAMVEIIKEYVSDLGDVNTTYFEKIREINKT